MGHSQRRPFSKFTSFHALKQRRYSTDQSPSPPPHFPPVSASSAITNTAAAAPPPPPPPPSFAIPFSPPPSIKTSLNYDDFDDSNSPIDSEEADNSVATVKKDIDEPDEPDTPCPSNRPTIALQKLKRPPNAYLLFNRDMRRKLLKQSPKMTVAEISKEVGDWWKALPDVISRMILYYANINACIL